MTQLIVPFQTNFQWKAMQQSHLLLGFKYLGEDI